jgi:AcrR family transcriptional regulator
VRNIVPARAVTESDSPVALRSVERALADRHAVYASEVQRLIDATYAVMRRNGNVDARVSDIVREAGLSNQAFYRHFRSKDELMLAVLDDGQRRLVGYLERRLGAPPTTREQGRDQIRAWIEGVMAQCRNPEAAANTRPFALSRRLEDVFPEEIARTKQLLAGPLTAAIEAAGGDPETDTNVVYQMTFASMHRALIEQHMPSSDEVEHLVRFALGGVDAGRSTVAATEGSHHGT